MQRGWPLASTHRHSIVNLTPCPPTSQVYVGGSLKQTLMIDIRGEFFDKAAMEAIMVYPPARAN